MDPTLHNSQAIHPPAIEIPEPPEQFGQDGSRFYRAYDVLAGEIDEDMTTSLKEQLDGMLVFAGLFAGVNTAFLALTIPLLSADPSDDTNALLAQNNAILMQLATGRNDTLSSNSALPSAKFAPSPDIFAVNVLFALSLAFAIISSFLAVLGRQWLVYYRKRGGGGPDRQRWEQLKRFLGARRWRMELILDDVLPSLLQIGLIIFCISLLIYLRHLSPVISIIVGIPMYVGLAVFIGSALCTVWDRFCPYHSPLSHLLCWSAQNVPSMIRLINNFLTFCFSTLRAGAWKFAKQLKRRTRRRSSVRSNYTDSDNSLTGNRPLDTTHLRILALISGISIKPWLQRLFKGRGEESPESLQVIALQRAICTSDDPTTLLYATANIPSITDTAQMKQLWSDSLFRERFIGQFQTSCTRMQLRGGGQTDVTTASCRLYCAGAAHIMLSLDIELYWWDSINLTALIDTTRPAAVFIRGSQYSTSATSLVMTLLGYMVLEFFCWRPSDEEVDNLCDHLNALSDTLKRGDWRLLCLLSWVISNLELIKTIEDSSIESLRKAYRGDGEQASATLAKALEVLVKPGLRSHLDCDRILINMLQRLPQLVAVDQSRSPIPVEHKFALLESCEPILRSPRLPDAARQAISELRVNLIRVWHELYMTWVERYWNTEILLDVLERHLSKLITLSQTDPLYHEDIEILRAFSPPIQELFTPDETVDKWPGVYHKRDPFRSIFNELVLTVERMSRQLQKKARRVQDPDERWCHWEEESLSVKATLLLPSDALSEYDPATSR